MKTYIYKILKFLGFRIITNKSDFYRQYEINNLKKQNEKLKFLLQNEISNSKELYDNFDLSKSQICQDWFVLNCLNFKKRGYFVEIGAASGVELSNTYLLEKKYNWNGLLSEPAPHWKDSLEKNRNCNIDFRCVFSKSNELVEFYQTEEKEYSTIANFIKNDNHYAKRKNFKKFQINTITLEDLFKTYNVPNEIDYLSIDIEGSEYEILKDFNFQKYFFRVITIEHNNTVKKDLIDNLITQNGYRKVFENFSQFESWFVSLDLEL